MARDGQGRGLGLEVYQRILCKMKAMHEILNRFKLCSNSTDSKSTGAVYKSKLQLFNQLLALLLIFAPAAFAEPSNVILHDHFETSSLDTEVWRLPSGSSSFLGRTRLRSELMKPTIVDGVLRLELDTFDPAKKSGDSTFLGSEIITRQVFPRGDGLTVTARVRFVEPVAKGLVASVFLYRTDGKIRDEIDFEILSNDVVHRRQRVLTNVFDDDDFTATGKKAFVNVPGIDLTRFNVFRIDWLPDRVQWFINGNKVREERHKLPNSPLSVRLNCWAPDRFFEDAFSDNLTATNQSIARQKFIYEVDYVEIASWPP